jgi:hypothetical protein
MGDRLVVRRILLGILLVTLLAPVAISLPPVAMEFYGDITQDNLPIPAAETVLAYDNDNVSCGLFSIVNAGHFGLLSCEGDDLWTSSDEGCVSGGNVRFYYNNTQLVVDSTTQNNSYWTEGAFRFLKLRVWMCGDGYCDPPEDCSTCSEDCGICVYCGNGICEPEWGESCFTCPEDCGVCPTGGGGGGGAGGGGAGDIGAFAGLYQFALPPTVEGECEEDWVCSEWTNCSPIGLQYRTCEDLNDCGTDEQKPLEVQECEYIPTCSDGVQNCHKMPDGTLLCEEGVDCGGPCPPCPSCHDGIRNQGETGIDCGGPCAPCPSCFDGLQNCHRLPNGTKLCEEGIDCGGPCPPCGFAPAVEKPALIGCGDGVCTPEERCTCPADCQVFPLRLLLWGLVLILFAMALLNAVFKYFHHKGTIAKPLYITRRNQLYFSTALLTLYFLIGIFYSYLFCACPPICIKFLFLPLALAGVMTIIALELYRRLRFSEKRQLKRLQKLIATHEAMLKKLIASEDILLEDLEQDVVDLLAGKEEPRLRALVDRVTGLNDILARLRELLILREARQKSKVEDMVLFKKIRNAENELAGMIKAVLDLKGFQEETALQKLGQQLGLLQNFYDQKKTYFMKMDKLLDDYLTKS